MKSHRRCGLVRGSDAVPVPYNGRWAGVGMEAVMTDGGVAK